MGDEKPHPVPGVDYPRNLVEFEDWFSSEDACLQYLCRLRWRSGFRCPGCGGDKAWPTFRGELRCAVCQRQTSPTSGTIFQGTTKPLRLWFRGMWYITNQKFGASALGLQRVLGFGSYQTAWTWLHKMRRAMVRPDREKLHGIVEVDEIYVGGLEEGVHGRQTEKKTIVVIAVEIHEPMGFGRVRLGRVPDVSGESLTKFVRNAVESGSVVHTDGWKGYDDLPKWGYVREKTVLSSNPEPAHVVMPGVHRIAALLKRWLLGTHQGAASARHLDYYLDEYTFRFNRRASRSRGLLFYRLMEQAVETSPTSYKNMVGGKPFLSET